MHHCPICGNECDCENYKKSVVFTARIRDGNKDVEFDISDCLHCDCADADSGILKQKNILYPKSCESTEYIP